MPRIDSQAFTERNESWNIEPRYYAEVSLDDTDTDVLYICTHPDINLPAGATASNTFYNALLKPAITSQSLNPIKAVSSIGFGSLEIADIEGAFTEYLKTKYDAGKATDGKRVRIKMGFKGLDNSDYSTTSTQRKTIHHKNATRYVFETEDIQRTVKKDIFDLNETTISRAITIDQVAIPVVNCSDFELNWHDANYTDEPSASVGYISLKDKEKKEVIKYFDKVTTIIPVGGTDISFTASDSSINTVSGDFSSFAPGMLIEITNTTNNNIACIVNTATTTKITTLALDGVSASGIVDEAAGSATVTAPVQFYNCTRAMFNTRKQKYEIDLTTSADRNETVSEYVYLETAAPKIIYALLTGVWYGTANTCPSNWHLGIDTSLVNSSSFIDKKDLYDTSDQSGLIFEFTGQKKRDAKRFLYEQLCRPMGCFLRVLNDGDLALRRMVPILGDAMPVATITEKDIIRSKLGEFKYDSDDLHNFFIINWNHEDTKGAFTRRTPFVDATSVNKYYLADPITLDLEGVKGNRHTISTINNIFNNLRSRYAGPPCKLTLGVTHRFNALEIGEVVKVTLDNVPDPTGNTISIDRSFEILGKSVDWKTGVVMLRLQGTTDAAEELTETSYTATVLADSAYATGTGLGLQASKKLDSVLTTSLVGDVLHITANGTLTGADTITNDQKYWYDGPVTIDPGVTVTFTKNIQIYCRGHFTNNGTLTGEGQGHTGGTAGTAGFIGNAIAGAGLWYDFNQGGNSTYHSRLNGTKVYGANESLPYFNLEVNDTADTITGLPEDLQGTSGGKGGDNYHQDVTGPAPKVGQPGGASGGGCAIISRGASCGANGKFIASGIDGTQGLVDSSGFTKYMTSGRGAGGSPGGFLFVLDGTDSVNDLTSANFELYNGESSHNDASYLVWGTAWSREKTSQAFGSRRAAGHAGPPRTNRNQRGLFWNVQYLPQQVTAAADVPDIAAPGTGLTFTETKNSPSTSAQNLSSVQVDVTAPAGAGNYAYSNIYYKLSTLDDDEYQKVGPAKDSVVLPPTAMDGSTYDVIAKPVSINGVESDEYYHKQVTVSNEKGGAVFDNGNYLKMGKTSFADTAAGGWFEKIASGFRMNLGSATKYLKVDTDAADIVTIVGKATIDSGTIGGFTINSTQIKAGTSSIVIDASNKYFAINDTTFGNAGIQLQYNAGSPRAYIGDGALNFWKYDTTNGVIVGQDVELQNALSYGTKNIPIMAHCSMLPVNDSSTSGGSVTQDTDGHTHSLNCSSTSDYTQGVYSRNWEKVTYTWSKNRKSKFVAIIKNLPAASNCEYFAGLGAVGHGSYYAGFRFDQSDGKIHSVSHDGTAEEDTDLSITWATATAYELEIVHTQGSNVKFYVDGVLKATHSTRVPSGTTGASSLMYARVDCITSVASYSGFVISDFRFIQDE